MLKPLNPNELAALIQKNPLPGADPNFTRTSRRLYLGGLPLNLNLTENQLLELFVYGSKKMGILTDTPILSVWISPDGVFCFVEYRACADCALAIELWQGLAFGGRPVRVGRPADYKPLPPSLSEYVAPVPKEMTVMSKNNANQQRFVGTPSTTNLIAMSMNAAVAMNAPKKDNVLYEAGMSEDLLTMLGLANLPTLLHVSQRKMLEKAWERVPVMTPTPTLVIENLITSEDIDTDEKYEDILIDVEDECAQYGSVLKVVIPRDGADYGKIFVRFLSKDEAQTARLALHGRVIDERRIACPFSENKLD